MPVDFHRLITGGRSKAKKPEGTDLGFLVIQREMCWNCYGEGRDYELTKQDCLPCKGSGFIERNYSLEMALAAMNIVGDGELSVIWISHPTTGIRNAVNEYLGVRIFASTSPELTQTNKAYALFVDMRGLNNGPSIANNLLSTAERVMVDFFSRYATSMKEVTWFYRNSDGGLDGMAFDANKRETVFTPLLNFWDCADFSALDVNFDNRLQLMAEQAAKLADERPY